MDEDAQANNVGSGNVSMPPEAWKKKKKTLIDRSMMDARTRAYREHRRKLESKREARLARKEARKSNDELKYAVREINSLKTELKEIKDLLIKVTNGS